LARVKLPAGLEPALNDRFDLASGGDIYKLAIPLRRQRPQRPAAPPGTNPGEDQ